MDADLRELLRRQRPGLGQNVSRDGELADVVQQGGRADRLDFAGRQVDGLSQSGRIRLDAPDVDACHLILGVNGGGQRFDRGEVKVRRLLEVLLRFQAH